MRRVMTALAACVSIAGCAVYGPRVFPTSLTWTLLRAPAPAQGDQPAVLSDGLDHTSGWYCSEQRAPHRYEVMLEPGGAARVGAVGMELGNVPGPGLGVVTVRVQRGYGVTAQRKTFRATMDRSSKGRTIVVLPGVTAGDHVSVSWLFPQGTASVCVAEIAVFPETEAPDPRPDDQVVRAELDLTATEPTAPRTTAPLP